MMTRPMSQAGNAAAIAALTLALGACGRAPYPTPTPEVPPPPPPAADLMGAPPSAPVEPSAPQVSPPPPPESPSAPAQPPAPQNSAEVPPAQPPPSAPVVIAMAPIPNPPEPTPRPRAEGQASDLRGRASSPAPAVKLAPRSADTVRVAPPASVAKPAEAPALKAPPRPPAAVTEGGASPLSERSNRLAALEIALTEAVSRQAELNAPRADEPGEVTLTLPAEFARTVRDEAARNDLAEVATSVSVTAALSGEGYAILPDTVQARPLIAGQPIEFHWAVAPREGRRGPLVADIGADLPGAGRLSLGSVRAAPAGFAGVSNRLWGLLLLAIIAGLVVAFLARGRYPARREPARRGHRPLS